MATKISAFQVKTHVKYRITERDKKRSVYINGEGTKGLILQLETTSVRYNASDYKGDEKYSVNINIEDASTIQKMKEFDESNVAFIAKEKILDKPREKLEAIATPSIKINEKNTPNTFMKLALYKDATTNQFDTKIFQKNAEGKLVEITSPTNSVLDILKRGAVIKPLIKASSIWTSPIGMGCSWKLEQALLVTPSAAVSTGASLFVDEEDAVPAVSAAPAAPSAFDEEEDEEEIVPAVSTVAAAPVTVAAPAVEEEEEEEEEVVQPTPPPKKKVAAKKAVAGK
jgi:hypothetical protein